jgi:hypothetical protein
MTSAQAKKKDARTTQLIFKIKTATFYSSESLKLNLMHSVLKFNNAHSKLQN